MGVAPELAHSAIRISLGMGSGNTDIQRYLSAFGDVIKRLKQSAKDAA
jgi:cysteine desulfurase